MRPTNLDSVSPESRFHRHRSHGSGRRSEELEGDVVGIAEAEARPVRSVLDVAVVDAQLVEPARPLLQLAPAGTPEGDVVEANAELAELLLRGPLGVLVQPDEGAVAHQVAGVV